MSRKSLSFCRNLFLVAVVTSTLLACSSHEKSAKSDLETVRFVNLAPETKAQLQVFDVSRARKTTKKTKNGLTTIKVDQTTLNINDYQASAANLTSTELYREHTEAVLSANQENLGLDDLGADLVFKKITERPAVTSLFYQMHKDGLPIFTKNGSAMVRTIYNSRGELSSLAMIKPDVDLRQEVSAARLSEDDIAEKAKTAIKTVTVTKEVGHESPLPDAHNMLVDELHAFQATDVNVYERGMLDVDGELKVVDKVYIKGIAAGHAQDYQAFIDSESGELIHYHSTQRHYSDKGTGQWYDPSPINPIVYDHKLWQMNHTSPEVRGINNIHDTTMGNASSNAHDFDYAFLGHPDDEQARQPGAYNQLYKYGCYFKATMGYSIPYSTNVDMWNDAALFSHYDPAPDNLWINMVGGGTYADNEDFTVLLHEFEHRKQHIAYFNYPNDFPFSEVDNSESAAAAEGLADFLTCNFHEVGEVGSWTVANLDQPFVRTCHSNFTIDNWRIGNQHLNGTIFANMNWIVRRKFGNAVAARLTTQMLYYVVETDEFAELIDDLKTSVGDFYGATPRATAMANVLDKAAALKKIGPPVSFPDYGLPQSSSFPHADSVNQTINHDTGMTHFCATTSAYDRIYTNPNLPDKLEIFDGNGAHIPGSPFIDRLQSKTFEFNVGQSDFTVHHFSETDERVSAGYRFVNIGDCQGSGLSFQLNVTPDIGRPPLVSEISFSGISNPDDIVAIRIEISVKGDTSGNVIDYVIDTEEHPDSWIIEHVFHRKMPDMDLHFSEAIYDRTVFWVDAFITDSHGVTTNKREKVVIKPWVDCQLDTENEDDDNGGKKAPGDNKTSRG